MEPGFFESLLDTDGGKYGRLIKRNTMNTWIFSWLGAGYAAHMDRGLTQEKMAKVAKLSVPYVSRIERGKKKASISAFYGTLFVFSAYWTVQKSSETIENTGKNKGNMV